MQNKKNVSTTDALFRITMGLTGVAWGTAEMIRRPYGVTPLLVTMASAMKVAEGITRYCPVMAMMGISSEKVMDQTREAMDQAKDTMKHKAKESMRQANEWTEKAKKTMLKSSSRRGNQFNVDLDMSDLELGSSEDLDDYK
ncbi:YgaP family membrane protein [Bacillus horti]|uniref:Inner membrane protein YgaP-like transmembrane domain-containing protein n=1 Tax=Caldalkalibacillus horti TaxID=77523 RepID=A0ABT9VUG5_9BACI|nr:DUF2892 domain-containing protein [Bacillus horti]MDQ0164477.1 hypothetical protein [Bacillus horti]